MNPANRVLRALPALALCAMGLAAPRSAPAQLTTADSAAILLAAAEDLGNRGRHENSEVLYRLIVESFPGTPAAAAARAGLDGVEERRFRAGGEAELRIWSTMYGIWQGVALPSALGTESNEAYGVAFLVGGPAGLLLGRRLVDVRRFSPGQARAVTWGGTWGVIQGLGWAHALNLGGEVFDRYEYGRVVSGRRASEEAVFGAMIVGGGLGILGGLAAARREIGPGAATSAMLGSLWGLWFGYAGAVIGGWDPEHDVADRALVAMMLTGNAGLWIGANLGGRVPLSRSRAQLISLAGAIGVFAGIGANMVAGTTSDGTAMAVTLGASIAGLAVGASLTGGTGGGNDGIKNAEDGGSPPPPGALVSWSGGDWTLATPLPSAVWRPSPRGGGREGPSWKVPLLKLRF